ncbi:gluconate 2-dehydrogenase subunit 3 family protein [Flavitalea sp. BT771]|uniref:gluconate 2-dehydrogenase subunit 3 family protein n=1 Tax=Flavitalea sp. BT771 TaxID=3063329 RepID=UPI0026E148D8|nr:gluconate 2-dehydrogenase subunit 3 family protein [Flavitalea sp. BT771]MDO6431311.1 gluconate 2-dehydrogenase subunit 3 family protein [Flavitalea sp. BT771]MDV6220219.1 gluconate 2-dehydrogenase subunit 3 family protein [Flavitalea sp. BT771]
MDRRKSIKALIVGTVSTGVLVEACKPGEEKKPEAPKAADAAAPAETNRMKEEEAHYKEVVAKTFFTPGEMATITILGDIIIPKDEHSGSASDAKVPEFIEFIVKDMPSHQIPMRGGLRWLDVQCLNRYEKAFSDCTPQQQIEMVDAIAYPKKAKPEMAQGVAFFNLMRNLVATGFFTSQMGVKDLGYAGNIPNQWNGVPDDVLKQYGLAYTEKELKECVSFT